MNKLTATLILILSQLLFPRAIYAQGTDEKLGDNIERGNELYDIMAKCLDSCFTMSRGSRVFAGNAMDSVWICTDGMPFSYYFDKRLPNIFKYLVTFENKSPIKLKQLYHTSRETYFLKYDLRGGVLEVSVPLAMVKRRRGKYVISAIKAWIFRYGYSVEKDKWELMTMRTESQDVAASILEPLVRNNPNLAMKDVREKAKTKPHSDSTSSSLYDMITSSLDSIISWEYNFSVKWEEYEDTLSYYVSTSYLPIGFPLERLKKDRRIVLFRIASILPRKYMKMAKRGLLTHFVRCYLHGNRLDVWTQVVELKKNHGKLWYNFGALGLYRRYKYYPSTNTWRLEKAETSSI